MEDYYPNSEQFPDLDFILPDFNWQYDDITIEGVDGPIEQLDLEPVSHQNGSDQLINTIVYNNPPDGQYLDLSHFIQPGCSDWHGDVKMEGIETYDHALNGEENKNTILDNSDLVTTKMENSDDVTTHEVGEDELLSFLLGEEDEQAITVKESIDEITSSDGAMIQHAEEVKQCGWEDEDNKALERLVAGQLVEVKNNVKRLNWARITDMFNAQSGQQRSKVQVYSHFRNYTRDKNNPCYTNAEVEALRAFAELGMTYKQMARLLPANRNEKQIDKKLEDIFAKMLNNPEEPDEEELARREKFRERVKHVVFESGWLCQEDAIPEELVNRMNLLLTLDPKLLRNNHPIGVGRPKKPKVFNNSAYDELAALLRPFTYVNNRRKRTTGLCGDGRKYGLNMFALYRLLGSSFDTNRFPVESDTHSLLEAGVKKVDHQTFIQFRELVKRLGEQKLRQDQLFYLSDPDRVPSYSLLPPTLHTLTGLRGLVLYKKNLVETCAKREEVDDKTTSRRKRGVSNEIEALLHERNEKKMKREIEKQDSEEIEKAMQEADENLTRTLESLFTHSFALLDAKKPNDEGLENSDGATDSEEEIEWIQTDHSAQGDETWGQWQKKGDE